VTSPQSEELTSAVPPSSGTGYLPAAACQDQYRTSSTLAIYDAQQALPTDSKPHNERGTRRPLYSTPTAANQQNVYDHSWDGNTVHQRNALDFSTGQHGGGYDNQLILTNCTHEAEETDAQHEERRRGDLTYGCAPCAWRGRRCTGCESWRPAG
jgi:hypothetical protein